MNKQLIADWTKKGVGGLTVASVVWIYATFATKSEIHELREANKAQWRAISDLRVAVGLPTIRTNTPP